jgi:asparagine synthase (glutamine-hydrolysing)
LAILDLSDRASQPMASADGKIVVTFNGEVYNYKALRSELEAVGARLRTSSDTEILLHLYARCGTAMVHRLRGMLAFAIWDETRRELFLARDPYGIKPLCTAKRWLDIPLRPAGQGVARERPGFPRSRVGRHRGLPSVRKRARAVRLYRDIRALPAGHTQRIDMAGPRKSVPFASLATILAAGAANPAPLTSSASGGVRQRMRPFSGRCRSRDVVVGGLRFRCAARSHGGDRPAPGAITPALDEFRGTKEDEALLAAGIAERYGVRHIVKRIGERELHENLPAIIAAMDQPSIDGVNPWFLAKIAKEAGLRVALSGLGGDELLAGHSSFTDVPRWCRRFGSLTAAPGLGQAARALICAFAPGFARRMPKGGWALEYRRSWAGTYLLRCGLPLAL